VSKKYVLGVDLGAQTGIGKVFEDGEADVCTVSIKNELGAQLDALYKNVKSRAGEDCKLVVIEKPFTHKFMGSDVKQAMFGAVVLACEHAGVPYRWVNLMTLKKAATGKGNAKKPEMIAAAKARFGLDMNEHEADAAHCAAYGWDVGLFD
jgi:Holliday junction resolvasome RuvABC endonuclease subunit